MMKFAYHATMCPPEQYLPLAIAAEEAGFDTFTFPDSICYPQEGSDVYPYNDDGTRDFLDGVPFLEPFVAIPYLAARAEKLHFTTSVIKLAIRQPVIVAKQLSSLAVILGDRLAFGVGISPWEEDFAVAGVAWEKRGKRFDEQIAVLRGLETGEFFGFDGEMLHMPANKMCPVPSQPTPLLIGGHAEPALKRAARLGDGWMCAGADMNQLEAYITRINNLRDEYGTDDRPFRIFTTGQNAFTREGIAELEAIGVTDVVIGFRNVYEMEADKSLDEKIAMLEWYAGEFIKD